VAATRETRERMTRHFILGEYEERKESLETTFQIGSFIFKEAFPQSALCHLVFDQPRHPNTLSIESRVRSTLPSPSFHNVLCCHREVSSLSVKGIFFNPPVSNPTKSVSSIGPIAVTLISLIHDYIPMDTHDILFY
jgi:hypothetical protein